MFSRLQLGDQRSIWTIRWQPLKLQKNTMLKGCTFCCDSLLLIRCKGRQVLPEPPRFDSGIAAKKPEPGLFQIVDFRWNKTCSQFSLHNKTLSLRFLTHYLRFVFSFHRLYFGIVTIKLYFSSAPQSKNAYPASSNPFWKSRTECVFLRHENKKVLLTANFLVVVYDKTQ